jgi:predicted nucleotidyltransferase
MKNILLKENYTSENLWKKINILTEDDKNKIASGLEWTVNNASSVVLVGGTAVVHYIKSARDLTPDLDFMARDINSIKTKLSYDNIQYNELNPGYEEPLGITVDSLNTDYLDPNVGNRELNKLILSDPVKGNIGGHTINIINPELLTILKFESSRDKDVQDALALLGSGNVNKEKYKKYLEQLKPTLTDYESMKLYANMIN